MTQSPPKTLFAGAVAPRRPHSFTTHGITVMDDYAWLKDARWQEVLRDPSILDPDIRNYLEAENDYTESLLGHTAALQKKLVAEMRGRIKEDDSSVPVAGRPVRLFAEISRGRAARDVRRARRARAAKRRSCSTATRWPRTTNTSSSAARGIRRTTNCRPGAPTPRARNIFRSACATGPTAPIATISSRKPTAAVVWSTDANSFFYVKLDDNHRPMQVWRHRLGTKQADDTLVYEEQDSGWFTHLHESSSAAASA